MRGFPAFSVVYTNVSLEISKKFEKIKSFTRETLLLIENLYKLKTLELSSSGIVYINQPVCKLFKREPESNVIPNNLLSINFGFDVSNISQKYLNLYMYMISLKI